MRLIADERLRAALQAMHADPARPWALSDLARLSAMSRTTFVERFRAAAGVPPITYLHQWRIRLAERALLSSDTTIAQLAQSPEMAATAGSPGQNRQS
jgi:transcriptional regulator GlxA family with amidase domain